MHCPKQTQHMLLVGDWSLDNFIDCYHDLKYVATQPKIT